MAFEIPESDQVSDAESGGFEIPESDKQGPLETAGRAALRNIPLAQQAVAGVKGMYAPSGQGTKAYSDELQHLTEAAEQGKAQNPTAYGIGAVTGTLAPLLLGQPEGLAANVGLNAGLTAAQGISDTNLAKNPGLAAKQAGQGALVGAGTAGIMGKLGDYLGAKFGAKAAPAIAPEAAESVSAPLSTTAGGIAPGASLEAAGPSAQSAPISLKTGLVPDVVNPAAEFTPSAERVANSNFLQGLGMPPRKFQQFAHAVGLDPDEAATAARQWSSKKGLVDWLTHPGETLKRVGQIKEQSGKTIGSVIEKFGNEPVPTDELIGKIKSIKTVDPTARGRLAATIENLQEVSEGGYLDWGSLNEIKGLVGEYAHDDRAMGKAYGVLADKMSEMADKAAAKIGEPGLGAAYETAKADYRMSSLLKPGLEYRESKDMLGGPSGHHTLMSVLGKLAEAISGFSPSQIGRNALVKTSPMVSAIGGDVQPIAKAAGATAKVIGSQIKNLPQEAQYGLANYLESKYGKKGQ